MTSELKPDWQEIPLTCSECHHQWEDWSPCHCPVDTVVAHWRSYRCPKCGAGADKLGFGHRKATP